MLVCSSRQRSRSYVTYFDVLFIRGNKDGKTKMGSQWNKKSEGCVVPKYLRLNLTLWSSFKVKVISKVLTKWSYEMISIGLGSVTLP